MTQLALTVSGRARADAPVSPDQHRAGEGRGIPGFTAPQVTGPQTSGRPGCDAPPSPRGTSTSQPRGRTAGSTLLASARGRPTPPAPFTPNAPGEGPRRPRRNSEHRRLVELGERLARERHPDATEVAVNPAHEGGPVIEIWGRSGFLGLYRIVRFEL